MNSFQPVRTIRSQVYQVIREQIINGSYLPGAWLQEQEIALALKVSRSPVREALRQIVSDGLADEIPNKGVFVRTLTQKDVHELCELRTLLEGHAIRTGAACCTPAQRQELEQLISSMTQAHARNDHGSYEELDSRLHMLLIELSGSRLLQDTYRRTYWMVRRFSACSLRDERRFEESLAEHQSIVTNILTGDGEEAARQASIHLMRARDAIDRYLEQGSIRGMTAQKT